MPEFTLVPSALFSESTSRELLSEVVPLKDGEPLSFVQLPAYDSVLVYTGQRPRVFDMLMSLFKIRDYNKILASIDGNVLSLVVSRGDNLAFCNAFEVVDFTTAEYYIFMVLKKLQVNPEQSSIFFSSPLTPDQKLSLSNYFKSAEELQ